MSINAPRPVSNRPLKVVSHYEPAGDQPKAIRELAEGVRSNMHYQTPSP